MRELIQGQMSRRHEDSLVRAGSAKGEPNCRRPDLIVRSTSRLVARFNQSPLALAVGGSGVQSCAVLRRVKRTASGGLSAAARRNVRGAFG
jgi:hypothetical protein